MAFACGRLWACVCRGGGCVQLREEVGKAATIVCERAKARKRPKWRAEGLFADGDDEVVREGETRQDETRRMEGFDYQLTTSVY